MPKIVEIRNLEEIQERMKQAPRKFIAVIAETIKASLFVFWENVPPYVPAPATSTYNRTGTMGRTLGVSQSGQKLGQPDIFEVRQLGANVQEGHFGTNLNYAPYVIGERGQQSQFMSQYWWRLEQVIGLSYQKIMELFDKAVEKMVEFIEGRGA